MSHGDRQRGDALARRPARCSAARTSRSPTSTVRRARHRGRVWRRACRAFPGFAISPPPPAREKGAQAGRSARRPLAARPRHPRRRRLGAAPVGRADPVLGRLRALHPVERRRRLSLGPAQHARARRPPPRRHRRQGAGRARRGSPPGAGVVAAGADRAGRRAAVVARRSRARCARSPRRNSTMAG